MKRMDLPEIRKELSDSVVVGFRRSEALGNDGAVNIHINIYINGEKQEMSFPKYSELDLDYGFLDALLYDNHVIVYYKSLGKKHVDYISILKIYDMSNRRFIVVRDAYGRKLHDLDNEAIFKLTPFKTSISVIDLLAIINRWDQEAPQEFNDKQIERLEYVLSFITDGDKDISREEINEHIFSEFPVLRNYQSFDKPISYYRISSIMDDIYDKLSVEEEYNSKFSDIDRVLHFHISQIKKTKTNGKVKRRKK